jgi:hypothetical protein
VQQTVRLPDAIVLIIALPTTPLFGATGSRQPHEPAGSGASFLRANAGVRHRFAARLTQIDHDREMALIAFPADADKEGARPL